MISLVKVNLLTDDPTLATELRDHLKAFLQERLRDDPDRVDEPTRVRVALEWKHTVHTHEYMATLAPTPKVEVLTLPAEPRGTGAKKPVARPARRK